VGKMWKECSLSICGSTRGKTVGVKSVCGLTNCHSLGWNDSGRKRAAEASASSLDAGYRQDATCLLHRMME
jgi:hypothetical protein